jgi:hypothetical protein
MRRSHGSLVRRLHSTTIASLDRDDPRPKIRARGRAPYSQLPAVRFSNSHTSFPFFPWEYIMWAWRQSHTLGLGIGARRGKDLGK